MKPIFEIWSPHIIAGSTLVFDVTPANLPELNRLSAEWLDGCLASLGLQARALSWRVCPSRCNYYSNFPHADDWQDRWRLTWTINVTLSDPDGTHSGLSTAPTWFDRLDPSWSFEFGDDHRDSGSILMVAPAGDAARIAGHVDHLASELERLGRNAVETSTHVYDDGWMEGRVRFSRAGFDSDAQSLDEIVRRLEHSGFVTNWSRLTRAKLK